MRTLSAVSTIKKIAILSLLLWFNLSMAPVAEARGPYLPSDSDLILPGKFVAREGLYTDCDEWGDEPCRFPYRELVLIERSSKFEIGAVSYDCELIDDGPYGALSCSQVDYTSTSRVFFSCFKEGNAPILTSDVNFAGWYCR